MLVWVIVDNGNVTHFIHLVNYFDIKQDKRVREVGFPLLFLFHLIEQPYLLLVVSDKSFTNNARGVVKVVLDRICTF